MANFATKVKGLNGKPVTIAIVGIGNADEFAGTVSEVGDDYVELSNGTDQPLVTIPFSAIASLAHR